MRSILKDIFKKAVPAAVIVLLLLVIPAEAHEGTEDILINTGGVSFVDSQGRSWEADNNFNTGNTYSTSSSISGTQDDVLYQSERWDPAEAPELSYSVPVENGDYEVVLHFAEIYSGAQSEGARVFDVLIEGLTVLDDLDIYSEVGGYAALTKTFSTTVSDGEMTISFAHEVENPKISGIEIHPLPADAPNISVTPNPIDFPDTEVGTSSASLAVTVENTGNQTLDISSIVKGGTNAEEFTFDNEPTYSIPPGESVSFSGVFSPTSEGEKTAFLEFDSNDPDGILTVDVSGTAVTTSSELLHLRVNAGGSSYTDTNGNVWDADNSYNTGNTYSNSNSISGTQDDTLYQSERWDPAETPELLYSFAVENADYDVVLHFAEIYSGAMSVGARVFDVSVEGELVLDNYDIYADVGGNTAVSKTFATNVSDGSLDILFNHEVENPKISAIEVIQKTQSETHLAHAVAGDDQTHVDIDSSGSETATLDGSFSHTHAFDETIVSWEWSENGVLLAEGEIVDVPLSTGQHTITLTVTDSAGNTGTDEVVVTVLEENKVPGVSGYYFDFSGTSLGSIPDTSTLKPDWGTLETNISFASTTSTFSDTPFSDNFAARFEGLLNVSEEGTYGFALESNDGSRLTIDGEVVVDNDGIHDMQKVSGSKALTAGQHEIVIEYFDNESGAGLKFYWTPPGVAEEIVPESVLTHHYSEQFPVVNYLDPNSGALEGGNKVKLEGFGYIFPAGETTVNWGGTVMTGTDLNIIDDTLIEITAPSGGEGDISVSVTTANGTSNTGTYTYSNLSLPPVKFIKNTLITGISGPTSLAFGPDGKLYVGTQDGEVWQLTLDENFNVTQSIVSDVVQTSEPTYRSILGIAFNPLDDPADPKVYVTHSNLFHGQTEDVYRGKVSTLSGTDLSVKEDLVTGLPVSDHDHGVNGMEFGQNGELYIQVGGMTNAGVPGELSSSGELDEKKFSSATVVAHINRDNFDGNITYDLQDNQTGGFDVEVFASGQRNSFDLELHSNGNLYATDNGPNFNFGDKSVTCTDSGPDPEEEDELNLLVKDGYFGHANRFRGETDERQCVWRSLTEPSDIDYTAPLTTFPASTNGLAEYWTNNFGGQLKGHLIAARWGGELFDVELSSDGQSVIKNEVLEADGGLDVTVHYKGAMFVAENQEDQIIYYMPDEPGQTGVFVNSVSPFRGPLNGGREALIYGSGFDPASVSVTVGGKDCPVSGATSTEILCTLPAGDTGGAVDVTVSQSGDSFTLQDGFIYMNVATDTTAGEDSDWLTKTNLPVSLGEVSSAAVGGAVYVFAGHDESGLGNTSTFKYDVSSDSWTSAADQTVVPAVDHAAAEVIDGKIYMVGGFKDDGTESAVLAIYDPVANTWTTGAPLTKDGSAFGVGSPASAVIDGQLYVAGGIHSDTTVANTFVYDPTTDSWSELSPMPVGRNHSAGVGYNGKFYIFGGRCCGGNFVDNTFGDSFVYDPATNTWTQAADMPTARGGMGTAVELSGELLVIGGEGGGPSDGTFPNVEAYDPITDTWRALPDLPTSRHGIYPVNLNGKIHVVAGGTAQGFSVSDVHEVYDPEPEPTTAVRINAGGGSYVDSNGSTWSADNFFNTGNTYSTTSSISSTTDDTLYQSERWDPSEAPELEYLLSVDNGDYQVVLHFADIYSGTHSVGARVFDVSIEGTLVLDNLDIYSEVGAYAALTKSFNTSVSDGVLDILFTHEVENPKISAIEIIPL